MRNDNVSFDKQAKTAADYWKDAAPIEPQNDYAQELKRKMQAIREAQAAKEITQ